MLFSLETLRRSFYLLLTWIPASAGMTVNWRMTVMWGMTVIWQMKTWLLTAFVLEIYIKTRGPSPLVGAPQRGHSTLF